MLFCHILHTPNLRSNFCYYRRLKRFQMILHISNVFGSRGGATEILTMISVQKCHFLAVSEYCLLFIHSNINNDCLVYWYFELYSDRLSSNYLCNKNGTIPCFIILISNRSNFAVRDHRSFYMFSAQSFHYLIALSLSWFRCIAFFFFSSISYELRSAKPLFATLLN